MFVFKSIANKLTPRSLNEYASQVMSYEFIKDWIIKDIQERLYKEGTTASGKELETNRAIQQGQSYYSKLTKHIKTAQNQRIENVTLNDTGAFYNSLKVNVNKTFYSIFANFDKKGSNIFDNFNDSFSTFDEFKSEILNLSDESLRIFYDKLFIPEFNAIMKNAILSDV